MEDKPPYAVMPAPDDIKITKREWEILKALRRSGILDAQGERTVVLHTHGGKNVLVLRCEQV